jgi:hypothetical protein
MLTKSRLGPRAGAALFDIHGKSGVELNHLRRLSPEPRVMAFPGRSASPGVAIQNSLARRVKTQVSPDLWLVCGELEDMPCKASGGQNTRMGLVILENGSLGLESSHSTAANVKGFPAHRPVTITTGEWSASPSKTSFGMFGTTVYLQARTFHGGEYNPPRLVLGPRR